MAAIEVKNLKKYFGKTKAIDDISFTVEKGEIFGFLGPNGAGKTTTIRCMMNFIAPLSGNISILDKNAQKDYIVLKKQIGYLSGNVRLYDRWTGQDHIDFVADLNGTKGIVDDLIKRLNFNPKVKTKHLSSGNRQKLGIIMAFMTKPEVLILDEPTLGLDPLLQNEIYELLEESTQRDATVFMSSHNLVEVDRICSRVGIIKEGKMVATESIRTLKEKRMYTVTAYFSGDFDRTIFTSDGIQITKELSNGLAMSIKGDLNPLLKKLAGYNLKDLQIEHASLEDIFLEFYEQ